MKFQGFLEKLQKYISEKEKKSEIIFFQRFLNFNGN